MVAKAAIHGRPLSHILPWIRAIAGDITRKPQSSVTP
jgi:hypothetical protein